MKIALRNIFSNRRRSAITLAVIVFGAIGLILFGGYKAITFRGLRQSFVAILVVARCNVSEVSEWT